MTRKQLAYMVLLESSGTTTPEGVRADVGGGASHDAGTASAGHKQPPSPPHLTLSTPGPTSEGSSQLGGGTLSEAESSSASPPQGVRADEGGGASHDAGTASAEHQQPPSPPHLTLSTPEPSQLARRAYTELSRVTAGDKRPATPLATKAKMPAVDSPTADKRPATPLATKANMPAVGWPTAGDKRRATPLASKAKMRAFGSPTASIAMVEAVRLGLSISHLRRASSSAAPAKGVRADASGGASHEASSSGTSQLARRARTEVSRGALGQLRPSEGNRGPQASESHADKVAADKAALVLLRERITAKNRSTRRCGIEAAIAEANGRKEKANPEAEAAPPEEDLDYDSPGPSSEGSSQLGGGTLSEVQSSSASPPQGVRADISGGASHEASSSGSSLLSRAQLPRRAIDRHAFFSMRLNAQRTLLRWLRERVANRPSLLMRATEAIRIKNKAANVLVWVLRRRALRATQVRRQMSTRLSLIGAQRFLKEATAALSDADDSVPRELRSRVENAIGVLRNLLALTQSETNVAQADVRVEQSLQTEWKQSLKMALEIRAEMNASRTSVDTLSEVRSRIASAKTGNARATAKLAALANGKHSLSYRREDDVFLADELVRLKAILHRYKEMEKNVQGGMTNAISLSEMQRFLRDHALPAAANKRVCVERIEAFFCAEKEVPRTSATTIHTQLRELQERQEKRKQGGSLSHACVIMADAPQWDVIATLLRDAKRSDRRELTDLLSRSLVGWRIRIQGNVLKRLVSLDHDDSAAYGALVESYDGCAHRISVDLREGGNETATFRPRQMPIELLDMKQLDALWSSAQRRSS